MGHPHKEDPYKRVLRLRSEVADVQKAFDEERANGGSAVEALEREFERKRSELRSAEDQLPFVDLTFDPKQPYEVD